MKDLKYMSEIGWLGSFAPHDDKHVYDLHYLCCGIGSILASEVKMFYIIRKDSLQQRTYIRILTILIVITH